MGWAEGVEWAEGAAGTLAEALAAGADGSDTAGVARAATDLDRESIAAGTGLAEVSLTAGVATAGAATELTASGLLLEAATVAVVLVAGSSATDRSGRDRLSQTTASSAQEIV